MSDRIATARSEGREAGRNDEGRVTCPYEIDGAERTAWLDGYTEGSIEANAEAHAKKLAPPADAPMRLRDALDAFVPAWDKLERKTSREFVVVTALIVAEKQEPRSDLARRFIEWAVARFGNADAVQGALEHALKADWDRMPLAFRELVQAAHRGERTVHDVVAWSGDGDDHPLVGLLKQNLLTAVGVDTSA